MSLWTMNEKNIPIRSVCVYCGSQPGRDQSFMDAGRILGKSIAENHLRLVYAAAPKASWALSQAAFFRMVAASPVLYQNF
jgi:hypothetical protein